jgi:hypothetical protein
MPPRGSPDALSRAPLFEALSRRELVQLARISDDLEVQPGKVSCKEGEVGRERDCASGGDAADGDGHRP